MNSWQRMLHYTPLQRMNHWLIIRGNVWLNLLRNSRSPKSANPTPLPRINIPSDKENVLHDPGNDWEYFSSLYTMHWQSYSSLFTPAYLRDSWISQDDSIQILTVFLLLLLDKGIIPRAILDNINIFCRNSDNRKLHTNYWLNKTSGTISCVLTGNFVVSHVAFCGPAPCTLRLH